VDSLERKIHWDNIYSKKQPAGVSWHQDVPVTSLSFIKELSIPLNAKIMDCGGGDSNFVDNLLDIGFEDITVLDISEQALMNAKQRLGDKAGNVKWVNADEAYCKPCNELDFWHDRASFHFLTDDNEIDNYIRTAGCCVKPGGYLVIGTFSESGPEKCSGIEVKRYSESSMAEKFSKYFEKIKCITVDHITPFNTVQNFIFCSFRRRDSIN